MKSVNNNFNYPHAPLSEVVEDYFGTRVADPYRKLEDLDDSKTQLWLTEQEHLTGQYLSQVQPFREALRRRLSALWQYPKYSVLTREGPYYFFWGQDLNQPPQPPSIQNQAVLYRLDSLEGLSVPILDLNQLDPTGESSISYQSFSPDGQLVAYALSTSGSDRQTVKIRSTGNAKDYPEALENCKFVNIAWKSDNSGFFYNQFRPDKSSGLLEHSSIFWHSLGTPQSHDRLVFDDPQNVGCLTYYPQLTDDGCYLLLHILNGSAPTNRVYYRPTDGAGSFVRLLDDDDAHYLFLGNQGATFYFQTDHQAAHGKVIALNLERPMPENWTIVVPEMDDILDFGLLVGGRLALVYLRHACHRISVYRLNGSLEKELPLPPIGSVVGLTGKTGHGEMFVSFESPICPPSIYQYEFTGGELRTVFRPQLDFAAEQYETSQVFYPSVDGKLIPMFLSHKKGLKLDGSNPTLLYGYGGFGLSVTPQFWLSQLTWLETGGVLASANIRGGGEYGEKWHRAGRLGQRQNTFDDFCQAARFLFRAGYTRPDRLALRGSSNGGLLVATCAVQHPDLFRAVVCQAPVIDMLRYQHFGSGRAWVPEYGSAEASQEEFEWLYAYSPLHNIKEMAHPAFLVMVPLGDERVHPSHGLKFVAALQACDTGPNPLLLWLDRSNGHGQGKPGLEIIGEAVDIFSFLWQTMCPVYSDQTSNERAISSTRLGLSIQM